ncbi:uncharacterized protein LOC124540231 [Vanessa cardui]|uniref:uncharacterized protein LOC124540231 n=1 Tax=Vanessa cardui TaxID=171605 RepID=UPI001F12ABEA|nr:uncharacterized protein LOC124540231 [Vanessa cardui]
MTTVGDELDHVLSPSDFLRIGGPVTTQISDRDFLESATATKTNLVDGWKRGQMIIQEFAKMFTNQYLTSLRERSNKHREPRVVVKRTPKLNEIVQIKADGSRANWKVGKISELIKGSDGQIRIARVKMSSGETLTRSIAHLFPLEIDESIRTDQGEQSAEISNDTEQFEPNDGIPDELPDTPSENVVTSKRPTRLSALKAKNKVKEWTSQLMSNLFNSS